MALIPHGLIFIIVISLKEKKIVNNPLVIKVNTLLLKKMVPEDVTNQKSNINLLWHGGMEKQTS
jgi:hypothetical protein